ncbi:hypothetical protein [Lacinutrix sp. 5H-3-7-4]|uniref:hypothetical protein n=1 Tax=Lacinutrix sp. (strain 5H-3-7-4) TaxID=983544 RepID=UPI00020A357C|nr:hypothetical protein [Lacinutrix sp. 5H-3-7-4]AEH01709.1 hypothetical protein Lacal_1863 [Lacinutrix sp. 5H-3-7-4]
MRKIIFSLIFLVLLNCSNSPETFIDHVNGYWEIESVTLPDGTKKEYTINQTIDYIIVNDSLKGFRKKMTPNYNGSYETSKNIETLNLKIENDSLNIYYSTQYTNWKETILLANEKELKIVNKDNKVYTYKRFTPININ